MGILAPRLKGWYFLSGFLQVSHLFEKVAQPGGRGGPPNFVSHPKSILFCNFKPTAKFWNLVSNKCIGKKKGKRLHW